VKAVTTRPARLAERGALIALQGRAALANEGDREALLAHPEAIDLPAQQIIRSDVIVAEREGRRAGFSAIEMREDGDAQLDGLFVEPDLWRCGLGRLLVERAADRAREHGARILHVIGNPHAEGFYLRLGFVTTGRFETQFGPGLLMELPLGP